MYKQMKLFLAACIYYGGPVKLLRWLTKCSGQHLIILNYHRASGGNLRSHLLYLRRHYRLLHLNEALEELFLPPEKQKRDRRTPLVLTFDDGYRDNYTQGLALAQELEVPMTIFLVPGYIESGNCFWWMANKHLLSHTPLEEVIVEGCVYHLKQPAERNALMQKIDARLRYATSVAEREEFLGGLREVLDVSLSATVEDDDSPLKWADIQAMEESRWISFGAHSMHHPILAYLKDRNELQYEASMCRTVLEQRLGHPVQIFAYPIGKTEHIGAESLEAVREAGYRWAVTTISGTNTKDSDPYQLRRIECGVDRHWLEMAAETVGLWQIFSSLKHYTFKVREESHQVKTMDSRELASKRSM